MLLEKIKSFAKSQNVRVYFDMDGVLADYDLLDYGPTEKKEGFYSHKRPIKSTIKIAEHLSKIQNVEVCILSNCVYTNQRQRKVGLVANLCPVLQTKKCKNYLL